MHAPELAALAVLEHAIHCARLALLAQHPQLLDDEDALARGDADPGADVAERFLDRAHEMYVVIQRYRVAVANAPVGGNVDDGF